MTTIDPFRKGGGVVVARRSEPADPDHVRIVRLRDGESIRVKGDHRDVLEKLERGR